MEGDMNQPAAIPTLCRGGCGFYGSSASDGLCSKCFKESLKRRQDPGRNSPTSQGQTAHGTSSATTSLPIETGKCQQAAGEVPSTSSSCSSFSAMAEDSSSSEGEAKKKPNRCRVESCKKKVGLTGFECRCGGLFCATHRYSDAHQCSFDYKALGAEEIRRNNPVVKGEKIQKL